MARTDVHEELDALKADIGRLRDDLGRLTEGVFDVGRTRTDQAKHRVENEARHRLDQLRIAFEKARNQSRDTGENIQSKIEERPLISLLAAFGIGLLLGKLFIRR